jgi:hypothetical protein
MIHARPHQSAIAATISVLPTLVGPLAHCTSAAVAVALASLAHAQCGTGASCHVVHATPWCNNAACCTVVCAFDPWCCNTGWDATCVSLADAECSPEVLGGPVINPNNGRRYVMSSTSLHVNQITLFNAIGATFASLTSGVENEWVRRNLLVGNINGNLGAYIGLSDGSQEGTFVWYDGSPLGFTYWQDGEPNNQGNEDVVEMATSTGGWNDLQASTARPAIGEFGFAFCGTGGSCFTTHSPGCSDEACCAQVCSADPTCCTSSWDADCVNLANATCIRELLGEPVVNPATRSTYYLVEKTSWLMAANLAASLGGHLVTIENVAENEWIRLNFRGIPGVTDVFIGLHDQQYEGTYAWTSHAPATYLNWAQGEPNNVGAGEDAAEMYLNNGPFQGQWNDISTSASLHAIIEIECSSDLDGDGTTGGADLAILLGAWGNPASLANLNHDTVVDGADLAILLGDWGPCPQSDACVARETPGSDQPGCTLCVCQIDPACCDVAWDAECVAAAATNCNVACQCGG